MLNHFKSITDAQEKIVERFMESADSRDIRFTQALDKRDAMFEGRNALTIAEIKTVQVKLDVMNNTLIDHDAKTDQALADMRAAKLKQSKSKTVPLSGSQ